MKKILFFLLLLPAFLQAQTTHPIRGISKVIYGGDTLTTKFSTDSTKFVTNNPLFVFNKDVKVNKDTLATKVYARELVDGLSTVSQLADTALTIRSIISSGGESEIKTVKIPITSANILAGDTLELVPAQGVGKVIIPTSQVVVRLFPGTGYAGLSGTYIYFLLGDDPLFGYSSSTFYFNYTTNTLSASNTTLILSSSVNFANKPLKVALPTLTTGDRSGWISISYYVIDEI